MRKRYNLSKGLNLQLLNTVTDYDTIVSLPARYACAMTPDDFPGFRPKVEVKEGDRVGAGAPLLYDKSDPDIKLVAPVGGTVKAIERGERRHILRVVVEPDSEGVAEAVRFPVPSLNDPDELRRLLKLSGQWVMIRRRPFDVMARPTDIPRDIFVTAMDTAPQAIDPTIFLGNETAFLTAGVKALRLLTTGHIYIGVSSESKLPDIEGAEMCEFKPVHPAGNAGVQAANIAPVNKGEVVWTLDLWTLRRIGKLVSTGELDTSVCVTVTGPANTKPGICRTQTGVSVKAILDATGSTSDGSVRIISGNVLTGVRVEPTGYMRYPYTQLSLLAEGTDRDEMMGWASLSRDKMSASRAFPAAYNSKKFAPDAKLNGGRRAMILSGVYDSLIPMDIMPEYLIKAILARDIDRMEALGIYEVAPEDFALAEFADPSKLELQKIVREGLDYMMKETDS